MSDVELSDSSIELGNWDISLPKDLEEEDQMENSNLLNFLDIDFENMEVMASSLGISEEIEAELQKSAIDCLPPPETPVSAVPPEKKQERPIFDHATDLEDDLSLYFDARQAKSTKKNTAWGMKIFQDWNREKNGHVVNMEEISVQDLAEELRRFYVEARPKRGDIYHRNTLINIRGAINRHLADIHRNVDIVRDKEFKHANGVLDGLLKHREKSGLSKPTNHKPIIEPCHLEKIATYLAIAPISPVILRQCIWFNLSIHFVTRGMEFHHQLTPNSFTFQRDESGEYVSLSHATQQKNHQGGLDSRESVNDKRMYSCPESSQCPVKLLKLFLEKTDANATHLFNQYNKDACISPLTSDIWYNTKPLAKRTFARFLSDICKSSNVDKQYTPHCLRATAIQFLNDTGFEARHIMYMSDHRCESSLRSYNRSVSTNQKKSLSSSLSALTNATAPPPRPVEFKMAITPTDNTATATESSRPSELVPVSHASNSTVSVTSTNNIMSTPGFFANSSFKDCVFNFNS